ncbi:hypothetical protein [Aeromonas dhakensis]|uniref:hypothetical protein n=1 Tax=Aeromonas dhakensis TaxID=196024 RepID=UPI003571778F
MVRYTRPPSPTWQATTRSAPTKHLSDQHGQMAVKKSQAYENKGVIWIAKTALAVTDEGDEGVVSVIDTTKVTRSTLAGKESTTLRFFSSRAQKNAINNRFIDLGQILRRSSFLPLTQLDSMLQLATCPIGVAFRMFKNNAT